MGRVSVNYLQAHLNNCNYQGKVEIKIEGGTAKRIEKKERIITTNTHKLPKRFF